MTQLFPSVREVLELASVRNGMPRVVGGDQLLDMLVRWVHSAEVPDIASLLRGGELVLTTGIGLPTDDDGLRAFIGELAEVGVVALFVELGRRYHGSLPKTMVVAAAKHGLILVEVAYGLSFCVLLFRAFVATIPKELDEAAVIDGAGPLRLFFQIVLPLLRPVIVTVVVVQTVAIFNDFTNPLYYLPGRQNVTVQLTLYNFQSQFETSYNLLFMDILLVTIPPLSMYLFFNRQIVAGLTAGEVKG